MKFDSTIDTQKHINEVNLIGTKFCNKLQRQLLKHDASKLQMPEKEGFDIYTPKLAGMTYGSEEYKKCLSELKPYLDHHYENNSHHPEHFKNGISGMTLYDLVEMFCDWCAAAKRHNDGDIFKSLEINKDRFNMSEQLYNVFKNTAEIDSKIDKLVKFKKV